MFKDSVVRGRGGGGASLVAVCAKKTPRGLSLI